VEFDWAAYPAAVVGTQVDGTTCVDLPVGPGADPYEPGGAAVARLRSTTASFVDAALAPDNAAPPHTPPALADDGTARMLVRRHGRDVLITHGALLALLTRPGQVGSRWKIPAVVAQARSHKNAPPSCILEDPVPRAMNPWACMEVGLAGHVLATLGGTARGPVQQVYVVLTLGKDQCGHPGQKILVRTANALYDGAGRPVRPRVKTE